MFHFAKVTDILQFLPADIEEIENILSSLESYKSNIWYFPGHIFCSFKNGLELKSFDAQLKSIDCFKSDTTSKNLHLKNLATPICNIFFYIQRHNDIIKFIHILCRNGKDYSFCFDYQQSMWNRYKEISLWNVSYSKIESVTFHEEQEEFYWFEKNDCNAYSLFKRRHDISTTNILLMENCLSSNLYCLRDYLFIWPKDDLPPNVFLLWKNSASQMHVQIIDKPNSISFDKAIFPFDFKILMKKSISLWIKVKNKISWLIKIINPHLNNLIAVSTEGKIFFINPERLQSEYKFTLNQISLTPSTEFAVFRNMLILKGPDKLMYIVDLINETLNQKLDLSYLSNPYIWYHNGLIENLGMITNNGIYHLYVKISNETVDDNHIPLQILHDLKQNHMISFKKLEQVRHNLEKDNWETNHTLKAIKILLKELEVESTTDLLSTKLNKDLSKLLEKYAVLEQEICILTSLI